MNHNNNEIHRSVLLMSDATNPCIGILQELTCIAGSIACHDLVIVEEPLLDSNLPKIDLDLFREQIGLIARPETLRCQDLPKLAGQSGRPIVLLRASCALGLSLTNRNGLKIRAALEAIAHNSLLVAEGAAGSMLCHGVQASNRLHQQLGLNNTPARELRGLGMLRINYAAVSASVEAEPLKAAAENVFAQTGLALVTSMPSAGAILQENGVLTAKALGTSYIARTKCHQLGLSTLD